MASTKIPLELTAYAPDADGATLELQTTDTTVTDGSVLGKIEFKAPKEASGTDAILVGAAIEAVAEGTFAADNNATELVFKTGASEAATQKMVLTSGGSVGIAQSSPSSFDSGANKLVVGDTSVSSQGITIASDTNSIIYFADGTSGAEAYMGSVIYNHTNNNMTFRTNGFNTAMVIDSSQNVGIGVTPTLGALHVTSATNDIVTFENTSSGTTGAQLSLFHNSSSPADGDRVGAINFQGDDDGGNHTTYANIRGFADDVSNGSEDGSMTFGLNTGGTFGAEKMRLSGNNLHLTGGTDARIQLGTSGTGNAAVSNNTVNIRGDGDFMKLNNAGNGGIIFEDNGTEVMRVNSGGLIVKAGSNNSNYSVQFQDSSGNSLLRIAGDGAVISPTVYAKTTNDAADMVVRSSGDFERSTSSRRYKNTITDVTKGLAELKTLRPVNYKGNNDGDTVFYGLIAEEVHDSGLTEFVKYIKDEDGKEIPDALRYPHMVALCVKAIQEQQTIIDDLKSRLKTLEDA